MKTMRVAAAFACSAVLSALFLTACERSTPAEVEKAVTVTSKPSTPPEAPVTSPPAPAEVRSALERVFGAAVSWNGSSSSVVSGDFNGDGSPDLAVVVVPASGKLKDINDPLANWTVGDPARVVLPPANQAVFRLTSKGNQPRVRATDTCLAVIHGYGPNGWRDPQSRQAFLLKGAAAPLLAFAMADSPRPPMTSLIPHEDIIHASRGAGVGILYWTGSSYAWEDRRR